MPKPKAIALNRRTILAAAGAATAALAAPRILRAQGKELVVGGAASHKNFVETDHRAGGREEVRLQDRL